MAKKLSKKTKRRIYAVSKGTVGVATGIGTMMVTGTICGAFAPAVAPTYAKVGYEIGTIGIGSVAAGATMNDAMQTFDELMKIFIHKKEKKEDKNEVEMEVCCN